jgi:hypothetical protein
MEVVVVTTVVVEIGPVVEETIVDEVDRLLLLLVAVKVIDVGTEYLCNTISYRYTSI